MNQSKHSLQVRGSGQFYISLIASIGVLFIWQDWMREARVLGLLLQLWTEFNTITPTNTPQPGKPRYLHVALLWSSTHQAIRKSIASAFLWESNMTAAIKACFRGDQNKIHNNKESEKLGQSDKDSEMITYNKKIKNVRELIQSKDAYLVRPPNGYQFLMAGHESR